MRIVDQHDNPVAGASVSGTWSGGAENAEQFDTDAQGWGSCLSDWHRGNTAFTFCVTDVSKVDWTYDEEANLENCITPE